MQPSLWLTLTVLLQIPLADPDSVDTFSRFPDEPTCAAVYKIYSERCKSIRQDAMALGYTDGTGWIAGGQHAQQMRDELSHIDQCQRAWYACWWLTWCKAGPADRVRWNAELRRLIGPAAWVHGRMPW